MEEKELQDLIDKDEIIYINWLNNYEQLFELTTKALIAYGSKEKIMIAEQVIDIFIHMLYRKNQIQKNDISNLPAWVAVAIAAGYLHNLFYDGTLTSLFKCRQEVSILAKELNVPVNGIAAMFQMIEGQLGDRTPVESCIPQDASPSGLFAWACWFVTEYKQDKPLPNSTSFK